MRFTEPAWGAAVAGLGAAALGAAAYLVAAQARLAPRLPFPLLGRLGAITVAGVLLLRGCAGLASSGTADESTAFTRWDLALYSPLCLPLAAR